MVDVVVSTPQIGEWVTVTEDMFVQAVNPEGISNNHRFFSFNSYGYLKKDGILAVIGLVETQGIVLVMYHEPPDRLENPEGRFFTSSRERKEAMQDYQRRQALQGVNLPTGTLCFLSVDIFNELPKKQRPFYLIPISEADRKKLNQKRELVRLLLEEAFVT